MRRGRTPGLLLTLLIASGCQPDRPPSERFVVRDSAGIPIAWSEAPRVPGPVVVDPSPITVVPPDFASPEHLLHGARHAALLSDGGFVVGNAGANELLFFSSEGSFLGALGSPGDGPGEFQRLFGLHRCEDDRLVVEELSRLSLVRGSSRAFERNVQISGHLAAGRAEIGGVDGRCSRALMADYAVPAAEAANRPFDSSVSLYWADFESGARSPVGTFPGAELYPWELEGQPFPVRLPFGRDAAWAVHPDGVVFGSARAGMSYRLLGVDGQVLRIVRWAAPPSPVTDDDWDRFEQSREDLVRENPAEASLQPPRGLLPRPERKPPYAALMVDRAGRVWVRKYGSYTAYGSEPAATWWVFAPQGEWIAEVEAPDGLEVLAIGDSIMVGVMRDELDLERIQVHRFALAASEEPDSW